MKSIEMYNAYDCDYDYFDGHTHGKNLDIRGKEFELLISKCFEYSSCFSLIFRIEGTVLTYPIQIEYDNQNDYPEYDRFIIKSGLTNKWPGTPKTDFGGLIRYYRCCSETRKMIFSISDSLFKFIYEAEDYNPEDLCFYRADGTVLFASQIHEGECWLFPREDEDFADVLEVIPWYKSKYSLDNYNKYYNNLAVYMEKRDFEL